MCKQILVWSLKTNEWSNICCRVTSSWDGKIAGMGKRAREGNFTIWNTHWVVLAFSNFLNLCFAWIFRVRGIYQWILYGELYDSELVAEYWLRPCFVAWLCTEIFQYLCLPVTFPSIKLQRPCEENQYCPGRVAQLVWVLSRAPKVCRFSSRSGHIPRSQVWSLVGVHTGGGLMFLSLSLPLSFKRKSINVYQVRI